MPEGLGEGSCPGPLCWCSVAQSCLTLWSQALLSVHRISQARILEWVDISFSRRHTHIDTMKPGFLDRSTSCGLSWVSECRRKIPQCLLETSTLQISCDSRGLPTGSSFSQGKSGLKWSELRGQRETPVASPSLISEVVGGWTERWGESWGRFTSLSGSQLHQGKLGDGLDENGDPSSKSRGLGFDADISTGFGALFALPGISWGMGRNIFLLRALQMWALIAIR